MRPQLCCLVLLAAATALPAQAPPLVDPPLFDRLAGVRETSLLFGYQNRQVVHYQEIHDGLSGQPRTIEAIALRRSAASTGTVPAFGATFTMRLSTARNTAAGISSTFTQNVGTDVATVLDNRTVSFAASAAPPSTGLFPFEYVLPADKPFLFGGKGPLCLDVQVSSHTNRTALFLDLYQDGRAHAGTFGRACGNIQLTTTTFTNGRIQHRGSGLGARARLLLLVGTDFERYLGVDLPIELTAIGAPGCELLLAPLLVLPAFADSTGKLDLSFDASGAPQGLFYGVQLAAAKLGVNRLGLAATRAHLVLPVARRQAGRVWAESLTATTGFAQPMFGLVWQVR
ncbi:MAG: hypothetical protein ACYTGW_04445 [Planctomycetota bacterium]|jgi:hypothetical protein